MTDAWDLLVARDDLSKTQLVEIPRPQVSDGEVLLKVDRVGMTANNVTYGQMGDSLNYWGFFPAQEGWGRVPLWGFADVVESKAPGVEIGARVYGYLPTSSHLVVRPERIGGVAFTDASEHRAGLPSVYNRYALTANDPTHSPDQEDVQVLYRPLFFTSFVLDDFLDDNHYFGAERIVMASASSKTGYGTAFCLRLRERHPKLVALTSARNIQFTQDLGLYDEVVSYDDLETISTEAKTMYVDLAGSHELRARIHEHLGDQLVYDSSVGAAHMEDMVGDMPDVPGPKPEFFFAPTQIQKRRGDWGPDELAKRHARAWTEFAPKAKGWIEIDGRTGSEGLKAAWLEVLSGGADPRKGLVVDLSS